MRLSEQNSLTRDWVTTSFSNDVSPSTKSSIRTRRDRAEHPTRKRWLRREGMSRCRAARRDAAPRPAAEEPAVLDQDAAVLDHAHARPRELLRGARVTDAELHPEAAGQGTQAERLLGVRQDVAW